MIKIRIEIEEDEDKEDAKYKFVGFYDYKIFINDGLALRGELKDVLKFKEVNAIISCLDKDVNGDMFKDD